MPRLFLLFAAVSGFVSVALGAFGAHALKALLTDEYRGIWSTAVHYQFFHTLALVGVVLLAMQPCGHRRLLSVAGWSFILGILIFSGSLYSLCLTETRWLGAITPVGGLAFLSGWSALLLFAFKWPHTKQ